MDLTIPLENITLNIRVAVLIETAKGFVLEKHKKGFYFPVGGRVKAGESSLDAAGREVLEELGVAAEDLKLRAVAELFFGEGEERTQEICFVYIAKKIENLELGDEFVEYNISEIEKIDFRPEVLKEVIRSTDDKVIHLMSK